MSNSKCVACGSLLLDLDLQQIRCGAVVARLAPQVAAVAEVLMRRAGKRVNYDTLINSMYMNPDEEPENARNVLWVRMNHLRRILKSIGASEAIITLYNSNGYLLDADARVVRSYTPEQARVADAAVAAMERTESGRSATP